MDPMAAVRQTRRALTPIAAQPGMHALAAHPVPPGDLDHRNPGQHFQHRPVSLLGHAQLPQHERECQASSGADLSSIKRDNTPAVPAVCENFLYGFKAARRAARAANSARSPLLPLALPQRRRLAPVGWREKRRKLWAANGVRQLSECSSRTVSRIWQLSGAGMLPTLVLSGTARTCQERLRRRLRRSSTLDRTCPAFSQFLSVGQ